MRCSGHSACESARPTPDAAHAVACSGRARLDTDDNFVQLVLPFSRSDDKSEGIPSDRGASLA